MKSNFLPQKILHQFWKRAPTFDRENRFFTEDFEDLKKKRKDWLEIIYLTDDIHLTKTGNRMLSDKIIKESFKE